MPIVVPQEGATGLLYWLLRIGGAAFPTLELRLFSNDYEPEWESVTGDFVESSFSGYQREEVTDDTWSLGPGPDTNVVATYDTEFTWTSGSGTGVVYGYYLVYPASPMLVWCERFDVPIQLEVGLEIKLRPRLAAWSHYLPTP